MAWSNLTTTGNTLAKDYLHDFSTGAFTLPFTLDLANGFESFSIVLDSYNTIQAPSPSPVLGYAVLALKENTGSTSDMIVNYTDYFSADGSKFTRINFRDLPTDPNDGTLAGPYSFTYTIPGLKTASFYLYERKFSGFAGTVIPPSPYPSIVAKAVKNFTFTVFQQSVAVTRKNSSTGALVTDGSTINDMDTITNNTIILNKSNNRGDDIISTWSILKQDSNGIFQAATLGIDYVLGVGESLTTDTINLTWGTPGLYRIINRCQGTTSGSAGLNEDESIVNFNVGQSIQDTITLPLVVPSISVPSLYGNTTTGTNPLTGIELFTIQVNATIDVSNATWTQQIDANPPVVLPMSVAAWTQELQNRCIIRCRVKIGNQVIQSRNGFGPHTFVLPQADYQIGYEIRPKTGQVIISNLSQISQLVPPSSS